MAGKQWTEEEIKYLREKHQELTCAEIGKKINRTTKSVQHKFNQLGLEKHRAEVGEIVKEWLIVELFDIFNGQQNVTYCVIKSTLESTGPIMKTERLSRLTNNYIGYPDRRRKDNIERNTTHGMSGERIYSIWYAMKYRCDNEESYKDITVCKEWYDDLQSFYDWSIENEYDPDDESLTLDRIDPNGDYEPSNCRWTDWKTQQRNKKNSDTSFQITAFGETKYFNEWVDDERCVVLPSTLKWRIRAGWEPEKAITQPSERKRKMGLKNWLKINHPEIYKIYKEY